MLAFQFLSHNVRIRNCSQTGETVVLRLFPVDLLAKFLNGLFRLLQLVTKKKKSGYKYKVG
jgi:hypothetical protein